MIHKLITKYFALSYRVRLLGKDYNYLRATTIIVPLFCLFTVSCVIKSLIMISVASILLLTAISIGFFYFDFKPVRWDELDNEQKLFYGNVRPYNLTKSQLDEHRAIVEYDKSHRNYLLEWIVVLINPILLIITAHLVNTLN